MAIDLDKLTLGELKEIAKLACCAAPQGCSKRLPMPVGTKVFIRTITHHYTGLVSAVSEEEVELSNAAWIADDGRFHEAMRDGTLNEVEPYPDTARPVVNRATISDWVIWPFDLPRSVK